MTEPAREDALDMRPFQMADGPPIPWFLAEIIYRRLYRFSQSLEDVHRRGGFGWAEVAALSKHNSTPEQRQAARRDAREAMERAVADAS